MYTKNYKTDDFETRKKKDFENNFLIETINFFLKKLFR